MKTKVSLNRFALVIIVTVLATFLVTSTFIQANPSSITITEDSFVETTAYVIFKDGSTYKAKNGVTGAIDDSGTNARTVITNALDGLTSGRTWKEKVVCKGQFTLGVDETIWVPSYTIFEGGEFTISGSWSLGQYVIGVHGGQHDITIRDVRIDTGTGSEPEPITLEAGAVSYNIQLLNNHITGKVNSAGIVVTGRNILIDGNVIEDITSDHHGTGIWVTSRAGLGIVVRNNFIKNVAGAGFDLEDRARDISFIGNVVENANNGFQCPGGPGLEVGFFKIIGNTFKRNRYDGIYMHDFQHGLIQNNIIINNERYGIYFGDNAKDIIIKGNLIKDNSQSSPTAHSAIVMYACENITIEGNTITSGIDTGLLSQNAGSGQKIVYSDAGHKFFVGQNVRIEDDTPQSENDEIAAIDPEPGVGDALKLTMVNDLANTYTTAQNARIDARQTQNYAVETLNTTDYVNIINNIFAGNYGSVSLVGTNNVVRLNVGYPNIYSEASYIVFQDGSYTAMQEASTGTVTWSSTDASAIFNAVGGNCTDGNVFIKAGTYTPIDATISFDDDVNLYGEGPEVTILEFNVGGGNNAIEINADAVTDERYGGLYNLKITKASGGDAEIGVKVVNASHYVIENCDIRGFDSDGVYVYNCWGFTIRDGVIADNAGYGVNAETDCTMFDIDHVDFYNTQAAYHIRYYNSEGLQLHESWFENGGGDSSGHVYIHSSRLNHIHNNRFGATNGQHYGIYIYREGGQDEADLNIIESNTFLLGSGSDRAIYATYAMQDIKDNEFINCGGGIYLDQQRHTVTGNRFFSVGDTVAGSIRVFDNSIVSDNWVYDSTGHAIYVGNDNVVANNHIIEGSTDGIHLESSGNVVEGNRISDVTNEGIESWGGANNTISNNNIYGGSKGIFLGASDNNTIIGNTVRNSAIALDLAATSDYNWVAMNDLRSNTDDVGDQGTNTIWTDNLDRAGGFHEADAPDV